MGMYTLSFQLPVTFLTAHRVAMQGMYRRQNSIKENADSGVNISVRVPNRDWCGMDEVTTNVLIMASLALSPAITADAARQSPKPRGSKMGETVLPSIASMLSLMSEAGCILKLYDCRYHTRTEAVKITVKAFLINPLTLSDTRDNTAFMSGR